jgi:hypothetical protein
VENITYNIDNAYFPVTVYLREGIGSGGAIVDTNTHNFAGEYTFDNVDEVQYTIHVVDAFGCEALVYAPEVTTTIESTTTEAITTTAEVTTTIEPTTTSEATTTVEPTTTEIPTTTSEPTTTGI